MVIHHDKIAYGKIEGLNEEASEEELLQMLAEVNAKAKAETAEFKEKEQKSDDNKK